MDIGALSKVSAKTAEEVCKTYKASDDAAAALEPEQTPAGFLAALIERNLMIDAIRFLAHALPKREAVWWACLSARDAQGEDAERKLVMTLDAAEQWVRKPTEENRRLALARGNAIAEGDSPAAFAAQGAGWSSGSMGPRDGPDVESQEWMTGLAVFMAVLIAATSDAEAVEERLKAGLERGIDIANGGAGRNGENGGAGSNGE